MHRICGWALFSASDHLKRVKDADQKKPANQQRLSITKQFDFATSLKLSNEDKQLLPNPVKYLDRGGLTFLKCSLWAWMNSLARSELFHVTDTALASDVTLLIEFVTEAKESSTQATVEDDIVESLYRTLLDKVCNTRCNEFLHNIGKLSCITKNKSVDGSVSLRDKLTVYALKKNFFS